MAVNPLQRELKKRDPFQSPEQQALLNVFRTSDQFQNRFGRLFREYGLTPSQYNVLRILRGEGKPLPCLEIAERTIQVVPAMTGLLDRLEHLGMVRRVRSTRDRRVIHVELAAKAKTLLKRLDQPVADLHHELLGHLNGTQLRQLSALLELARHPPAESS